VTLPYEDQAFDVVVAFETIEHVKDDVRFLTELHRVIKDGGQCLLTTPNGLSRLKPRQKPWNRFHIREYAPVEWQSLLASIFSEVEIWGIIGTNEIQTIERNRVEQAQRLAALDPLNLRSCLPPAWETRLVTLVKSILRPRQTSEMDEDFSQTYNLDDYYLTQQAIEESFDLLARCQK
jgi:SAM-dependent methyltransferase